MISSPATPAKMEGKRRLYSGWDHFDPHEQGAIRQQATTFLADLPPGNRNWVRE